MKRKNGLATKEDVREAADAVLVGVEKLIDLKFSEQDKHFGSKYATKKDLKREIGFLRDDIKSLNADVSSIQIRG